MASYTTNLNLELPTVDERYDILKVNSNMEKIDDGYGVLNDQIAKSSLSFYGVYPNGKNYNQTYCRVTVPCWNPQKKAITISSAYVYDSSGGFIEITNAVTVTSIEKCGFMCEITFNSNNAGKMLLIDYSIAS